MVYCSLYIFILLNFSLDALNLESPIEGAAEYQNKKAGKFSQTIRRRRQLLDENDVSQEISPFPVNINGNNQEGLNSGNDEDALVFDYGDMNFRRPSTIPRQISPGQFSTTSSNLQESIAPTVSTVIIPGMGTRRPVCEETCPSTPEYNPVCGDDDVTYPNLGKLHCASRCGVILQFRGACLTRARGR